MQPVATIRFVLACGLDQISDPSTYAITPSTGLLPTPRDIFEVAERINIWWSVYLVERRLSLYMALPGGLPHGAHPVRS
jgi:hypothetical protein